MKKLFPALFLLLSLPALAQSNHFCSDHKVDSGGSISASLPADCDFTGKAILRKPVIGRTSGYVVADLAGLSPSKNMTVIVDDAVDTGDPITGGGSMRVLVAYDGSTWHAIGGGGGGSFSGNATQIRSKDVDAPDAARQFIVYDGTAFKKWQDPIVRMNRDCGIVGSGDETAALNTCIANLPSYTGVLQCDKPGMVISSTGVVVRDKIGIRIETAGGGHTLNNACQLVYTGAAGGTVVDVERTRNSVIFKGFQVYAGAADIGFQTGQTGTGTNIATGDSFEDIQLTNNAGRSSFIGFMIGDSTANNSDEMKFSHVFVSSQNCTKCGTAFKDVNTNVFGTEFRDIGVFNMAVGWDWYGNASVDKVNGYTIALLYKFSGNGTSFHVQHEDYEYADQIFLGGAGSGTFIEENGRVILTTPYLGGVAGTAGHPAWDNSAGMNLKIRNLKVLPSTTETTLTLLKGASTLTADVDFFDPGIVTYGAGQGGVPSNSLNYNARGFINGVAGNNFLLWAGGGFIDEKGMMVPGVGMQQTNVSGLRTDFTPCVRGNVCFNEGQVELTGVHSIFNYPTLTYTGTAGSTTRYYAVVACSDTACAAGNRSIPSISQSKANTAATLDGSNYVTATWTPALGVNRYGILQQDSGSPNSWNLVMSNISCSTNPCTANITTDSSTYTSGYPSQNETGGVILRGAVKFGKSATQPAVLDFTYASALGTTVVPNLHAANSDALSAATLDIDGTATANSDGRVPSQKAMVTYVLARTGATTALSALTNPSATKSFDMANFPLTFSFTGNYGATAGLTVSSTAGASSATGYLFNVATGHANNKVASFTNLSGNGVAVSAAGVLAKVASGSIAADTAATWATPRTLAGNSVDGSANVAFANKFIVQGTTDSGLSAAQFLGALGTGIVKNTTTTGVLSIAVAGDFPTLNQDTTGSAAKVNGVAYGAAPATDSVPVITASNTATYKVIGDCDDSGGNHLNYDQTTHAFSCGTSNSGGTPALDILGDPTGDKAYTMAAHTLNFNSTGNYGANWAHSISSSAGAAGATGYLFQVNAGHADNKPVQFCAAGSKCFQMDGAGAITLSGGASWPTFNQSTSGNAATADALSTAREINGENFDGSGAITVPVNNTDDTTTNATMYPLWTTSSGGNFTAKVSSTNFTWNPSTGNLTVPQLVTSGTSHDNFTALADGTPAAGDFWLSSTTANKFKFYHGATTETFAYMSDLAGISGTGTVTNTAGDLTSGKCAIGNGTVDLKVDSGCAISAGVITATGFSGPITGNVTGNVSGSSGSTTGNAATVTGFSPTSGKTLSVVKTMTLTAADDTGSYTLPTGTKTLLATDGSAASLTSFPTFNQSTTGSAATLTTPRAIYGNNFDGSAALTAIIASTYGGTGNGFTKFTGATTAERTYTLPDASTTIVTTNMIGALATGVLRGTTSTGVIGNAASSDVITLFNSGTCSGYLKSDGSCDTPGGAGTVTHTGNLNATANAVPVGSAAADLTASSCTITTGVLTCGLTGNVTGNASGTAATFTGSLSGDVTSSGMATTVGKINGTSFAGTSGHLVSFGASNVPADSGLVAANAVNASSPGAGIAHFAGSTQTVTSSAIVAADITNNTITGIQLAASLALTTPNIGAATGTTLSLGTDASVAGTVTTANGTGGGAHTIWSSGATTTNTVAGPTTVPTTGHVLDCTTASTTCTLHDSGIVTANVITYATPAAGLARTAAGTQAITGAELSGDATTSGSNAVTLAAQYKRRPCEVVIGGSGASGVLQDADDVLATCVNNSGATLTIDKVACYADAGSPTVMVTLTGGADVLTGNITCSTSFAEGTLSGTPTQTYNATINTAQKLDVKVVSAGGTAHEVHIIIGRTL